MLLKEVNVDHQFDDELTLQQDRMDAQEEAYVASYFAGSAD